MVAIVSYNNASDVQRCIRHLDASDYHDFSVTVCENGDVESYIALTQLVPSTLANGHHVSIVHAAQNDGFAAGVNLCIRTNDAFDAVWILNPDTATAKDALSQMVFKLSTGHFDAVGSTVLLQDNTIQSYGGKWNAWKAQAESLGHGTSPVKYISEEQIEAHQDYLNGASMLVTKAFLSQAGLMREDYFLYCEEVEWFVRNRRRPALGFAHEAIVTHYQGTTTGSGRGIKHDSYVTMYYKERNRLLLTRDVYPKRLPISAFLSLFYLVYRCLKVGSPSQLKRGLHGWIDGLKNIRGFTPLP